MTMLTSPEERSRKSRNIVFSALIILLVIWTVKLSFPQHTISLTVSSPNTAEASPVPVPPSTGEENQGPSTKKATSTSTSTSSIASSSSTSTRTKHYKPSATPWNPQVGTSIVSTDETFNGNITNKAAVIIETRFRSNLIPLILHFSTVLGPSWPILVYTNSESIGSFASSAALSRYIRSGLIQLRILPQTVLFTNSDSVNAFMTQRWLWEDLAPAEHILIFQSDSMLCANAARSVDDFFPYDFVGAPIRDDLGNGFNGGLSLRKRNSTLRILDEWTWSPKVKPLKKSDRFEDQWFYNRMKILQERERTEGIEPEEEGAINLPSMEVARTFSVETIDYPHPLGVHQVHRWMGDGILSLDEWCPEYKLCSVEHIEDTPSGQ